MNIDTEHLTDIRRHLHRNPELSNQEYETAEFIEEKLAEFGLTEIERVSDTGVVALVEGGAEGPTFGWRADIDALPIREENAVPYRSKNEGVMHACGHDVHTTVGLGLAAEVYRNRDRLRGKVKFIFQPAEEANPSDGEVVGAERMVQDGVLEEPDIDSMFALHCMPGMEVGNIGYTLGPVWANSQAFELEVHGTSSHGAYPHQGVDAIYVASELVSSFQSIPSRRIDSRESAVVSVGTIEGGESFNVLADRVRMEGIYRAFSESVAGSIEEAIRRLTNNISESHGATCDVDISKGARSVHNDTETTKKAVELLEESGTYPVVEHEPQLGAEDFAAFSARVPSTYFFLGTYGEKQDLAHGLHSSKFDVDEKCLGVGVEMFSEMLLDWS